MQNSLKVLLIGCGRMGGGFDFNRLQDRLPLTHAGAYSQNPMFQLAACIDVNDQQCRNFASYWNIPHVFASMDDAVRSQLRFDVISICSPTHLHLAHLKLSKLLSPKLVFCEKPLTSSLSDTKLIVEDFNRAKIKLAVNYTRRWDPMVLRVRERFVQGEWGSIKAVVCYYNKGILNNGSHAIDLLRLFFKDLNIFYVGQAHYDFFDDDPTIDVVLKSTSDTPIHLVGSDAKDYSLFEIHFICSKAVVSMEEGGALWRFRSVQDSDTFQGYRVLGESHSQPGEYNQAMGLAVENIYQAIVSHNTPLASDGNSALITQSICTNIKDQAALAQSASL